MFYGQGEEEEEGKLLHHLDLCVRDDQYAVLWISLLSNGVEANRGDESTIIFSISRVIFWCHYHLIAIKF